MDLIRDAVGDALARVRFFRLAFGHAGPDHMTSAREARTTLEALYDGGGSRPTWKPLDDMPRRQVKLAYLMMLCAESALPMGGEVTLSMEPGGQWSLTASADRIAVEDGLVVRPALRPRRRWPCASSPPRCSSSRSMSWRKRWRARSTTSMTTPALRLTTA
jgi:hypothetical protein